MIIGSGYAQGMTFDTPSTGGDRSNRVNCRNIYIKGCYYGINIVNHSFIMGFNGVAIVGASTCVYMGSGVSDAGENLGFNNCSFFNSGICVENYGGASEMYFHSCSFDYSSLIVLGSGVNNFIACHFEFDQPSGVAPFQNSGGMWYFSGGEILVSGSTTGLMSALFSTANIGDAITMHGTWGSNWACTSNGVMVGPGKIRALDLQIPSNERMPDALCYADRYNKLGPSGRFGSGVTAPIYLQPVNHNGYQSTPTDRTDAACVSGSSSGAVTLAAVSPLPVTSPLGTTTGLKVTRAGLYGANGISSGIWFAVPVTPGKKHTLSANIIFNESGQITPNTGANAEVYFEASYRNALYNDSLGRPVFNEVAFSIGESKPVLTTQSGTSAAGPSVAQTGYQPVFFTDVAHWDSSAADQPQDFNGCCPDSCNYLVFFVSDGNVPNMDYYLTDLCVWEW